MGGRQAASSAAILTTKALTKSSASVTKIVAKEAAEVGAKTVAPSVTKTVAKEAAEVGAKTVAKETAGIVPVISVGCALAAIGYRWRNPESRQSAGMIAYSCAASTFELASGIAACFPGVGTAVSIAIDIGVGATDVGVAIANQSDEAESELLQQ